MAGISSRAAGGLENKKKYNGIEFDSDLDLNTYEAYYRTLDPQIGRWWQIDPKCEPGADDNEAGLESLTPYNSMRNNPSMNIDPLGDADGWFDKTVSFLAGVAESVEQAALGAAGAYASDNLGGAGAVDGSNLTTSFQVGQIIGHAAAVVTSALEVGGSGTAELASGGTATAVAVPVAVHGATTFAVALKGVLNTKIVTNNNSSSSSSNSPKEPANKPATPSKVQKSTTVEKVGNFTKKTEVRPSKKSPGQSRSEYVTYKNKDGKTIRTYKDSYDRANNFQHRKPLTGGPEGRPAQ